MLEVDQAGKAEPGRSDPPDEAELPLREVGPRFLRLQDLVPQLLHRLGAIMGRERMKRAGALGRRARFADRSSRKSLDRSGVMT